MLLLLVMVLVLLLLDGSSGRHSAAVAATAAAGPTADGQRWKGFGHLVHPANDSYCRSTATTPFGHSPLDLASGFVPNGKRRSAGSNFEQNAAEQSVSRLEVTSRQLPRTHPSRFSTVRPGQV